MGVPLRNKETCESYIDNWGHAVLASIRGGMPMINKILTIVAFLGFVLEQVLNSSIPFRLLGVKVKKVNLIYKF